MNLWAAGDDIAAPGPFVTAFPVGDHSADFEHEAGAGGHVPHTEVEVEETIECARRRPGEIEGGGSGAAQVLKVLEGAQQDWSIAGNRCLLRNGNPVETTAFAGAIGRIRGNDRPFSVAPRPRAQANSRPRNGAMTTPMQGVAPSIRPTETPTTGRPRVKFVVPSSGSTAHMRSACSPPPSSARTGMSGVRRRRTETIAASLAMSVAVT